MNKIIDANFFQAPTLEDYLSSSSEHFVVLNEYACIEAYKGNAIKSISKSMETVSRFPDQVIVLKSTRDVARLTLSSRDVRQLEDVDETKGFRSFCRAIRLGLLEDQSLKDQIIGKGMEATARSNTLRDDAAKFARGIKELTSSFRPEHLRALRKREVFLADLIDRIIKEILLITALLCSKHPDIDQAPQAKQVRDSYIFRFAVSAYLLALRWISDGGPGTVSMEKMGNDIIDMNYVAYATLFDGLLTNDNKMTEIYRETCFVLENAFGVGLVV
jgi:hypothetical protein